ncbi:MAG: uncharacterized protein V7646_1489 [Pseudonocardia sp.]
MRAFTEQGDPAAVLVEHARRAEMLVPGNHCRGALAAAGVGSVDQRCAQRAHCSIVLVPPPDAGYRSTTVIRPGHSRTPPAGTTSAGCGGGSSGPGAGTPATVGYGRGGSEDGVTLRPPRASRGRPLEEGGKVLQEMLVVAIGVNPRAALPVLLLQEASAQYRVLPVWVGVAEANAIELERQHVPAPRPPTHQLICQVIGSLGRRLDHV